MMPEPPLLRPVRERGRRVWIAVLVAFAIGLGLAGWLGWRSGADFGRLFAGHWAGLTHDGASFSSGFDAEQPASTPPAAAQPAVTPDQAALSGRVTAMEQRLDRVDLRVAMAAGNAARAEALLVAFAVRRVVERGAPLGYLADQLKLRFGDAQPHAVATIVIGAKDLVPLDQLAARLELLAPQLTDPGQPTVWARVTSELADMFVIRRDRPTVADADARFDDARMALSEGQIDKAIADVRHLSTGSDAAAWVAAARRYREIESALDLIDTTALLAPHQLHDAAGNPDSVVAP